MPKRQASDDEEEEDDQDWDGSYKFSYIETLTCLKTLTFQFYQLFLPKTLGRFSTLQF